MTTSNIDAVISSVDEVKKDLRYEFRKRLSDKMGLLKQRARKYVMEDSAYTGKLTHYLDSYERVRDDDNMEFAVGVPLSKAPYAAIVEFGSGSRTNTPWEQSRGYGLGSGTGSAVPLGFPFEAPDIPHDTENPYNISGYPKFAGFVGHIEEWMKRKPVEPQSGDLYTSAVAIAAAIIQHGNYAHPYLRPAWFDTERQIKRAADHALKNATR